jgi:hypothetical protein
MRQIVLDSFDGFRQSMDCLPTGDNKREINRLLGIYINASFPHIKAQAAKRIAEIKGWPV